MRPSEYIERGWCQYKPARNAARHVCSPIDAAARAWCAAGALEASLFDGSLDGATYETLYKATKSHPDVGDILAWNDHVWRTQAEVLDVLRQAEAQVLG